MKNKIEKLTLFIKSITPPPPCLLLTPLFRFFLPFSNPPFYYDPPFLRFFVNFPPPPLVIDPPPTNRYIRVHDITISMRKTRNNTLWWKWKCWGLGYEEIFDIQVLIFRCKYKYIYLQSSLDTLSHSYLYYLILN